MRTVEIPDPGSLEQYFPDAGGVAWIRRGEGMIGLGVAASCEPASPAEADGWWHAVASAVDHRTALPGVCGSGPVAFGSFVFDPGNTRTRSRLIVPEVVIGRRQGRSWITAFGDHEPVLPPVVAGSAMAGSVIFDDSPAAGEVWKARVAEAVARIERNGLSKVVLARAIAARLDRPIDVTRLVTWLAASYPSCWTYALDGLVGASPEMLVRRERGLATSRVLAGTIRRSGSEETDLKLASSLARSSKNLIEHELAVASVAEALAPFCSGMNVPESPYVLQLPNVLHLATDVTGVARDDASALRLVQHLHPSAAVCGTPTDLARRTIAEIEGLDRGRYSGPVGWIDAAGDGEWAIALRCGVVGTDPTAMTLYAGCGIVAGSDPDEELDETRAKLRPMQDALTAEAAGPSGP